MQKCEKCGEVLPLKDFKKYSKLTDGKYYHSLCRKCEDNEILDSNWKDGMLKCFTCGGFLPEISFQKHNAYSYRNNRDKRCSKCKVSQNKDARKNYSEEKSIQFILNKRLLESKKRASEKNIEHNLDLDFLIQLFHKQEEKCAISKITMTYNIDSGRTYTNVSLDRINSTKGYTKDNVQLVCMAVNQLKSDLEMDVVLYICKEVVKNYSNGI